MTDNPKAGKDTPAKTLMRDWSKSPNAYLRHAARLAGVDKRAGTATPVETAQCHLSKLPSPTPGCNCANCFRYLESQLTQVREELEPSKFCEAPCGHSSQFCQTSDGGKMIICLICELGKAEAENKAMKADLHHFDKYHAADQDAFSGGYFYLGPECGTCKYSRSQLRALHSLRGEPE